MNLGRYYSIRLLYDEGYLLSDTLRYISNMIGVSTLRLINMMGFYDAFNMRLASDTLLVIKLNKICKDFNLNTRIGEPKNGLPVKRSIF